MTQADFSWNARWLPFAPSLPLSDGYLDAIRGISLGQTKVEALQDLTSVPCLVLLGQAGIGKTRAVKQAVHSLQRDGKRADFVNLGAAQDIDAVFAALTGSTNAEAAAAGEEWHLFVDGLDEVVWPSHRLVSTISAFLDELLSKIAPAAARVRFVCRTAAWLAEHDAMVEVRWREDQLQKLELGPLQRTQVAQAAAAVMPERADAFMASIEAQEGEVLAANPMLLRLLLDLFVARDDLPTDRVTLYSVGIQQLVRESRVDPPAGVRGDLARRVLVAGRIAAAMTFSGVAHVALDTSAVDADAVALPSIAGSLEVAPGGPLPVTVAELRAVLASPLFARVGADRFAWSHRSLMEFLAAHYLRERLLSADDIWGLLHVEDPDGTRGIAPQFREVAAWSASMSPEFFQFLIDHEPEVLLRSDVAAAAPEDRRRLIDALLERVRSGPLIDFYSVLYPYLGKLSHPALAEQLRPIIAGRDEHGITRRVSIELVEQTNLQALTPLLVDVARDESDSVIVRKDAVQAVAAIGTREQKAELVDILSGDLSVDRDDELRGAVLAALWPGQLPAPDLFAALTVPKQEHFIGAYAVFLYRLNLGDLSRDDALSAIAWLDQRLDADTIEDWDSERDRIFTQVFWACARAIEDEVVRDAFADLIVKRLTEITRHIFHIGKPEGAGWPHATQPRLALVRAILDATDAPERIAGNLLFQAGDLVRSDDLDAYLAEYRDGGSGWRKGQLLPALVRIIIYLARRLPLEEAEQVWEVAGDQGPLRDALRSSFTTELASPEVEWARRDWQRKQRDANPVEPDPDTRSRVAKIEALVDRIETGEAELWWQLNLALFVDAAGRSRADFEFKGNLQATPGWSMLEQSLRDRIVAGAAAYLRSVAMPGLASLGSGTAWRPAMAGYRAMYLLEQLAPAALAALPDERWRLWAPAILGFFENEFYTDGDVQRQLLKTAYDRAPHALLRATARIALGPKSRGLGGRELELIDTIADARMLTLLAKLVERPRLKGQETRGSIYAFLIQKGDSAVVERVRGALEAAADAPDDEDHRWLIEAGVRLLFEKPGEVWFELLSLTRRNTALARTIWTNLAGRYGFQNLPNLSTLSGFGLAQAFLDLEYLFPEKPKPLGGARELTAIDEVDRVKGALLNQLVDQGTKESLEQLGRIAVAAPDAGAEWRMEQARRTYRVKARPLPLPSAALAEIATLGAPVEAIAVPVPMSAEPATAVADEELAVDLAVVVPRAEPVGLLPESERLRILAFATEWDSGHGGISTLNRELCAALAKLGHVVWCVVPEASQTEIADALVSGVTLRGSPVSVGIAAVHRLLLLEKDDLAGGAFDFVLGHDHITGPFAAAKARQLKTRYVHFLHTVPVETEGMKTRPRVGGKLMAGVSKHKEQIKLSQCAALAVAIGPKIFGYIALELNDGPPLHMMLPGLNEDLLALTPDPDRIPRVQLLVTGRMEDASLKGVPLAAQAVHHAVTNHRWNAGTAPKLVLRGFDADTADAQFASAVSGSDFDDIIQARPFTTERADLVHDLKLASCLMMPSQSEGFGLTGFEAIAAGVPVLLSDESGLAEFIQRAADDGDIDAGLARQMILPAHHVSAAEQWSAAIVTLLYDRKAAFAAAAHLRATLQAKLSWNASARALTKRLLGA